jgi:hypothetical protein
MSNFKTVARFGFEQEAEYHKALLAEHGISSYISNAVIAESLSASIVGGIQLRCAQEDYEEAKRILDQIAQKKRQRRDRLKSQSFSFPCEECGAEITVSADRCGFVETCPTCKQYVDVPPLENDDDPTEHSQKPEDNADA